LIQKRRKKRKAKKKKKVHGNDENKLNEDEDNMKLGQTTEEKFCFFLGLLVLSLQKILHQMGSSVPESPSQ